jgi:hypothetical protein
MKTSIKIILFKLALFLCAVAAALAKPVVSSEYTAIPLPFALRQDMTPAQVREAFAKLPGFHAESTKPNSDGSLPFMFFRADSLHVNNVQLKHICVRFYKNRIAVVSVSTPPLSTFDDAEYALVGLARFYRDTKKFPVLEDSAMRAITTAADFVNPCLISFIGLPCAVELRGFTVGSQLMIAVDYIDLEMRYIRKQDVKVQGEALLR